MLIFLDTANLDEIHSGAKLGVVKGVTTNPSLVAKEGKTDPREYREVVQIIAKTINGPISAEVLALDAEGMLKEGREIAKWAPNVVVKLPCTAAGIETTSALSKEGVKVNQTLCFSVNQALLASHAGAAWVSPFVGRLDDVGHDGIQLVADIVQVFELHKLPTRVLAASIRHPLHVVQAAQAGAHAATIPYKVLTQMLQHPLTDVGEARFVEDWRKVARV